uniref:CD7 molecule n=2 Tax=Homininae TaxID=207598 RepID=J3QRF1_HUMAN
MAGPPRLLLLPLLLALARGLPGALAAQGRTFSVLLARLMVTAQVLPRGAAVSPLHDCPRGSLRQHHLLHQRGPAWDLPEAARATAPRHHLLRGRGGAHYGQTVPGPHRLLRVPGQPDYHHAPPAAVGHWHLHLPGHHGGQCLRLRHPGPGDRGTVPRMAQMLGRPTKGLCPPCPTDRLRPP